MTQTEYEQKKLECWEELWDEVSGNIDFAPGVDDRIKEYIYGAFDRAYALGKQEKDADAVISGWASRDKDRALILWESKPQRNNITNDEWGMANGIMLLPSQLFPDLTWDSEPEPVEIIIKRKKK